MRVFNVRRVSCLYRAPRREASEDRGENFARRASSQLDSTMPKISWSLYKNVSLPSFAPISPRSTFCPP